jgi:hypothetical protein
MSKIRLMPSVGRCICTICGLYAEAARLKANVCAGCAAAPDKARSLLDARASAARRKAEAAWLQLNHAVDVLGEYAPRWAAMRQALDEYHLLCADDDTRRRVERAQRAVEAEDEALVPAPLAACFRAYEALYWAGDAEKRERVKAEIALVALEDVLSPREAA